MSVLKIDDQEFDTENLSESAKKTLASLQYVKGEVRRLEAQIAAFKTAEVAYGRALKEYISNATS